MKVIWEINESYPKKELGNFRVALWKQLKWFERKCNECLLKLDYFGSNWIACLWNRSTLVEEKEYGKYKQLNELNSMKYNKNRKGLEISVK